MYLGSTKILYSNSYSQISMKTNDTILSDHWTLKYSFDKFNFFPLNISSVPYLDEFEF